ncbi:hypothetical protein [Clostridium saccharoperbutylacetonicum]
MKNLKKFFAVFLVTVIASTMLISCGGPKVTAEESVKIFLNVLLKNDKTNMDKIGFTEDAYNKLVKDKEDKLMKSFTGDNIDKSVITDEVKAKFKDSLIKGLANLSYELKQTSADKKVEKFDLKIKIFDMKKIFADAQNKAMQDINSNPDMTKEEIQKKLLDYICDGIAAGTAKSEPQTVSLIFTKGEKVWEPMEEYSGLEGVILDYIFIG